MPSFVTVTGGATAQAQDVNQLINAMNGTAGQGVPISLTAVNDSVNFALAVKNADPTNSRSLQVLRANNNVLLQADANGVIVSPDGGATTGQVLTVNATQTLTNKTFTSPHMTGPVVDSGGLTVTSGAITQTNAVAGVVDNLILKAGGNLASDTAGLTHANLSGTTVFRMVSDATAAGTRIKAGGILKLCGGDVTVGDTGLTIGIGNATLGFFGATPVAKQTAAANATDLASVISLANNLKAILQTYGQVT